MIIKTYRPPLYKAQIKTIQQLWERKNSDHVYDLGEGKTKGDRERGVVLENRPHLLLLLLLFDMVNIRLLELFVYCIIESYLYCYTLPLSSWRWFRSSKKEDHKCKFIVQIKCRQHLTKRKSTTGVSKHWNSMKYIWTFQTFFNSFYTRCLFIPIKKTHCPLIVKQKSLVQASLTARTWTRVLMGFDMSSLYCDPPL